MLKRVEIGKMHFILLLQRDIANKKAAKIKNLTVTNRAKKSRFSSKMTVARMIEKEI